MMRLSCPKNITVPDGYRFVFEDGTRIHQSCYGDWLNAIKNHYVMNDYPIPDNWVALAEDQLCNFLPPGFCQYDDGSNVMSHINTRLEMGDLFRGMEVLLRIATTPDCMVEPEEAERRAAICSACPANITIPGCAPCMKIPDLVVKINGGKTTSADQFLRSCAVCRCHLQAAVWVKDEVAAHGITPAMHEQFQKIPHCWKRGISPKG